LSNEAEEALLGGLIKLQDMSTDLAANALEIVKPEFFSHQQHSLIFAIIKRMAANNQPVDAVTIDEEAQKLEKGYLVDFEYLAELASSETPCPVNIVSYATIIREKAVQRIITENLHRSIALINDPKAGTIGDKLGEIEAMINSAGEFAQTGEEKGLRHAKIIAHEWLTELNDRIENGVPAGFTTGIKALDEILAPATIPEGSLLVVGARPKVGKTATLATIVNHFGIDRQEDSAVFSMEMTDRQLIQRMVVGRGKFNPELLYTGDGAGYAGLSKGLEAVKGSKIYIDDSTGVSLSDIVRKCRKLMREDGVKLKLVAVDYLTLVKQQKAERNDLAVADITRGLKSLAKEIGGVVLLLTQLNRQLEQRPNKRPIPSDSRDSGQIEQDCDLWMGLYRDSMYQEGAPEDGLMEMIVRLNRHGNTGTAFGELVHGVVQETNQEMAQQRSRPDV